MRFVVGGEALIDMVPLREAVPEPTGFTHFRTTWEAQSAGSGMNTAVALGRLGADVQYLGRMSTDVFGRQLAAHIRDSGVGLDLVTTTDEATSLAIVSLDERGKASYVFHFPGTANFGWRSEELPELDPDDWLHLASLTPIIEPGASALLRWVRRFDGHVSYDMNVRPSVIADPRLYWEVVRPWLQACSNGLVKASDDDVNFLARGSGHTGSALDIAAAWVRELGLRQVVVTLGPDGAGAVGSDGSVVTVPGHQVEVVDTVGAGDTFAAGLLEALARGVDLTAAMRQGVAASAIVVTRAGAQPPTREELVTSSQSCPADLGR